MPFESRLSAADQPRLIGDNLGKCPVGHVGVTVMCLDCSDSHVRHSRFSALLLNQLVRSLLRSADISERFFAATVQVQFEFDFDPQPRLICRWEIRS